MIDSKLLRILLTFIIFFGFFAKVQIEEDASCSHTLEWQSSNHDENIGGAATQAHFGHVCHFGHSCLFHYTSKFNINLPSKDGSMNNVYISAAYVNPAKKSIDKPPIS